MFCARLTGVSLCNSYNTNEMPARGPDTIYLPRKLPGLAMSKRGLNPVESSGKVRGLHHNRLFRTSRPKGARALYLIFEMAPTFKILLRVRLSVFPQKRSPSILDEGKSNATQGLTNSHSREWCMAVTEVDLICRTTPTRPA